MKEHLHRFGPIAALIFASLLAIYVAWRVFETGIVLCRTAAVSWSVRGWGVARSAEASPAGAALTGAAKEKASAAPTTGTLAAAAASSPSPPTSSPAAPVPKPQASMPAVSASAPTAGAPPSVVADASSPGKAPSATASASAGKYESIVKKGIFGMAPTPTPAVHVLTGVIGSKAIVDGTLVAVGGSVGDAKVVEIGPKKVVLEKDGQRTELQLFQ